MKIKSVQNCRFVHHAKFHCIMTMLNRLFSIEFERGDWKRAQVSAKCVKSRPNLLPARNSEPAIIIFIVVLRVITAKCMMLQYTV